MIPCCITQIKVHMNYKSSTEFYLKSSLETLWFLHGLEVTPTETRKYEMDLTPNLEAQVIHLLCFPREWEHPPGLCDSVRH